MHERRTILIGQPVRAVAGEGDALEIEALVIGLEFVAL